MGTRGTRRTLRTGRATSVHRPEKDIPHPAVVAHVQPMVLVRDLETDKAAADPARLRPHHLSVVADDPVSSVTEEL